MRLYGRQRLRGLSRRAFSFFQIHYPKLQVCLKKIPQNLWIEVGFGYGEHLIARAKQYPHRNFIGCEPFLNGMVSAVQKITELNLSNIMLYQGDARHILAQLPSNSLEGLYLLFPDPWPKTRHYKRRLVQSDIIKKMHHLLQDHGVWHIASDHPVYQQWVEKLFNEQSYFSQINHLPDGITTRYQEWAMEEGRLIKHYVWKKEIISTITS